MSMTRFFLIRHGETSWNEQKKYQGQRDLGLSKRGKKKIKQLSRDIHKLGIGALYTSPLKRARQSAAIIAKETGINPVKDSRLKEMSFGRWEGKTSQELMLEKDKNYLRWLKGRWPSPGGESLLSLRRRIQKFMKDCLKKHQGKNIAIVSHGGPIKMALFKSLKLSGRPLSSFSVEPASFTVLTFHSGKFRLEEE